MVQLVLMLTAPMTIYRPCWYNIHSTTAVDVADDDADGTDDADGNKQQH